MGGDTGRAVVDPSFTRRVKALARTLPVHDLDASKGQREGDWTRYDLRALALAAVDAVIDEMGLAYGATAAAVRARLAALARAAAPDRPPAQAEQVAAAVLDALLNDRERREAFAVPYSDWSGPAHRRAQLVFKLLEEVEAPDGTIVLRATDEAVNLFVGALDRDVEDAQAAAEAILESQLRRGRIDQAVATAREARLRSVQFAGRVRRVLDATRRDLRQVDWGEDVPRLLDDALHHLASRLDVERHLVATLRDTLDEIADAGEDGGARGAAQAAELVRLVTDCQSRHLELHEQLLGARGEFLAAQDRQRFAPAADARAVDLGEELLKPLLRVEAAVAEPAAGAFVLGALGPAPPRLARLPDLVDALLQPRRSADEHGERGGEPDLVALDLDAWRFSPETWVAALDVLDVVGPAPVRLSDLLADARRRGGPQAAELVALTVLHAFAPEGEPGLVARDDGGRLEDPDLAGADLLVSRPPERAEVPA
jgi:hypothetical protein